MSALSAPLLAAVNHVLGQAAWARARLVPFAGHAARFELPPLAAVFAIDADGRLTAAAPEAPPEVTIRLPASAPLLALQGHDAVMRQARLEGSAEFAEALGFVIRNLRWDAEEDLSRLVGDIAAHRLAGGLRSVATWQRQAARNLAENLAEYLVEEAALAAAPGEVAAFVDDIDRLRDDLARLEKRAARLGAG